MGSPVNVIRTSAQNYLINSLMNHLQRFGFVSATINASQTIKIQDRWITYINNVAFFTSATQGPTNITNPSGISRSALNFSSQASNTSAQGFVVQRIESNHAKDLANKKISLSFLIRNNNFTTVGLNLYYPNATDNFSGQTLFYSAPSQVLAANSTVKFVKFENILADSLVSRGLAVEIVYSGFSVGVSDDTALTEVMLNEGAAAIPFRPFGEWDFQREFAACQRYYERNSTRSQQVYDSSPQAGVFATTVPYKVTKRVSPVFNSYSPITLVVNTINDANGNNQTTATYPFVGIEHAVVQSTMVSATNRVPQLLWTADAEL